MISEAESRQPHKEEWDSSPTLYEMAYLVEELLTPRGWTLHRKGVLCAIYNPFIVFAWQPSSPDVDSTPTMIAVTTRRGRRDRHPSLLVTLADRGGSPGYHRRLSEVEELRELIEGIEAYEVPPPPANLPRGFQLGGRLLYPTETFMESLHAPATE